MTKTFTSPRRFLAVLALWLLTSLGSAQAATETITYFHNDVAGTPVLATDATGSVVWKENYQPYGSRINNASGGDNSQWFAGKPYDANTGLSYFGARYYDPVIGRFTGMDPAAVDPGNIHGLNRYSYGNNNPYRYVDPDGWAPEEASTIYMRTMIFLNTFSAVTDGGFSAAAAVAPLIARNVAVTTVERTAINSATTEAKLVVNAQAAGAAKGVNPKSLIGRQGRDEMSGSKVNRLAKDMKANGYDASHPIDAANVDGKLIILDGHHRAQAAAKAGVREVPVNVHNVSRQQADQLMREAAEARIGN
jgi:RHS repeat-associated protein